VQIILQLRIKDIYNKQNADNYLQESGLEYSIVRPGSLTDNDSTGKIDLKS
jgi:hypothetical protein